MINFLPWRQQLRQYHRQRYFVIVSFSLCFVVILMSLWHQQVGEQLAVAKIQLNKIKEQTRNGDQFLKDNQEFQQLLNAGQQLRERQILSINLLNRLSEMVSSDVQLSSMKLYEQSFAISGSAGSSSAITRLLSKLDRLDLLKDATLLSLQKQSKPNNYEFKIKALLAQNKQLVQKSQTAQFNSAAQ